MSKRLKYVSCFSNFNPRVNLNIPYCVFFSGSVWTGRTAIYLNSPRTGTVPLGRLWTLPNAVQSGRLYFFLVYYVVHICLYVLLVNVWYTVPVYCAYWLAVKLSVLCETVQLNVQIPAVKVYSNILKYSPIFSVFSIEQSYCFQCYIILATYQNIKELILILNQKI